MQYSEYQTGNRYAHYTHENAAREKMTSKVISARRPTE
jgi:hypothetical protein